MRNIIKIGLTACLMLLLSGCGETGKIMVSTMLNWMVYFAYILPVLFALMYQFKINNSKWYFAILIGVIIHIIWIGLVLLITTFSFKEILVIFY